ncbi:glucose-6-phosphate isomerase [Rummeliibacillus stabekisii]|uniref:Glucose-6-phosphate isomerase n=1 Tax=Rummeliibacillus stabekisii TaxID=241244 RepID=A0A143HE65_9BACL|nr:glucose-6-phosphate isomerase [Rummeliibacillus stabekisii]AMW99775.1 hypothetical protein ATY39_10190 [Rummeliibacillus stabekisii]
MLTYQCSKYTKIRIKGISVPNISHYNQCSLEELSEIVNIAKEIKEHAQILLVIGIGGSFLGARAVIDALTPYFNETKLEIIYGGQNMSGAYLQELLSFIDKKEIYVNVISKSGSTMEPALTFRIIKKYMEERYGKEAKQRIIVTTDPETGILKRISEQEGYRRFLIPREVGGRFSVFTAAGLLPIAVAGINIKEFIRGAKRAENDFEDKNVQQNAAYQYAFSRFEMYQRGYSIELLASFEPRLNTLHKWWKQLFGESEGKDSKGLYPSTVSFSTDLHAIGQFIQEGSRIVFETFLDFEEIDADMKIPFTIDNIDGLNYLGGRSMNSINNISRDGIALAHEENGIPVHKIILTKLDPFHMGYLMYFLMKACVISATLLDVNPFNQPGVEVYKRRVRELLLKESSLLLTMKQT